MFEEEIKNLKPFERYIISYSSLQDTYSFASNSYKESYLKIKFENTKYTQYYLDNITIYTSRLESRLHVVKICKEDIDVSTLTEYQKQQLKSGEDLLNKVETLLNDMNKFLSTLPINGIPS